MFTNYFKIALRNLKGNKGFAAINIVGLSIGLTCCMLLVLYSLDELSFDKHHDNASDLYLINSEAISAGGKEEYPMLSAPYADALKLAFPEVQVVTRLFVNSIDEKSLLKITESNKSVKSFYETRGYAVDSTFFKVFSYTFIEGNAINVLREPNSVVLSDILAHKLFGDVTVLGRNITIGGTTGNEKIFTVTGVYKDESNRSHINARFFVPLSAGWVGDFLREQPQTFSGNNLFYTYVRLQPGSNAYQFEKKFPDFMKRYAGTDLKVAGYDKRIFLIPISKVHFYSKLTNIVSATNSITYLYILLSIALFILIIACINFTNLSIASSTKRAPEIGMRKVFGATKNMIIKQYISESMVVTGITMVVTLVLLIIILPYFNQLTNKTLSIIDLTKPQIAGSFLLMGTFTGILASSYASFYLSTIEPLKVLKGDFVNPKSGLSLKKGLVIFQFSISIGLLLATFVIQRQMHYLRNKPLGFDKDMKIVIPLLSQEAKGQYENLFNEILQINQVVGVAGALYYPGIINPNSYSLYRADQTVDDIQSVETNWIAPEFMELMGFKLLKGRLFSKQFNADYNDKIVVNESALRKFVISLDKAVGQQLNFSSNGKTKSFEVIGVVKDFHFKDLHQPIQPYAFILQRTNFNYMLVHVKATSVHTVLQAIEQKWKNLRPNEPFDYSFLDEDFFQNYKAEERTARIVNAFTLVSIFISCLGLLGLAAFDVQQRKREIGIRKVLGASVLNVTGLLLKDYVILVGLAIVIACPLGYILMDKWLNEFAYRISIEWWMLFLAGGITLLISLITVSYQAIKAGLVNPMLSIRKEKN